MTDTKKASRSKSLDGIRGIAISLVILFHYGYFAAGWAGVQLFFTLSGYLITGILLKSRTQAPAQYFGTFFWHRALRILPVVYMLLIVCGLVYAASSHPASFGADWAWLVSFLGNFARMRDSDLGDSFVHLWSLAVEQQFYLLWPVLIFCLPVLRFRGTVLAILVLAPVIRFLVFQSCMRHGYDAAFAGRAAYVLPFTQFDAFAAGAAIPLWSLEKIQRPGARFLGVLGIAGMAGFLVLLSERASGEGAFIASFGYAMYLVQGFGYVWGYSLLNILSMLAIICALNRVGPAKLLEAGPPVWIGRISYGLYVYHVPLLVLINALLRRFDVGTGGMMRPVIFAAWVAAALAASEASFRWVETPILALKDYWRDRLVSRQVSA